MNRKEIFYLRDRYEEYAKDFPDILSHDDPRLGHDPFFMRILDYVRQLSESGVEVSHAPETAPFEGYLESMRFSALFQETVIQRLARGEREKAYDDASMGAACFFNSGQIRDLSLARKIAAAHKKNPQAIHLIFRGADHAKEFLKGLSQQLLPTTSQIQYFPPKGVVNILVQADLTGSNNPKAPLWRPLVLKVLLMNALHYEPVALPNYSHPVPAEDIVDSLTNVFLERWYDENAPREPLSIEIIRENTIDWLIQNLPQ